MESIEVTRIINAPVSRVWQSWADFGDIYKFNPNLSSSRLLSDKTEPTGIGSRRECELTDGKNYLREEIVEYQHEKKIALNVYESSMPIETMLATFVFKQISTDKTEVTMTSEFKPKGGWLGRLMLPLMRRQFRPMLQALLDCNASYVETGRGVPLAA